MRKWHALIGLSNLSLTNVIFVGVVAIIAYLVIGPMIFLLYSSFLSELPTPADPGYLTLENYVYAYTSPTTYKLALNTTIFVIASTCISVLLAFVFAWLLERTDIPAKGILFILILLPTAVPSMLATMSYIILAGPEAGLINLFWYELFGTKPLNIFSLPWLIILQGVNSGTSAFLILLAALRSMDPALEEAASVSGATQWRTAYRVTFPIMLPAILAASIYTGMNAAETFEMPALIGVPIGFHVFSSQVYLSVRVWSNHTLASTYSVAFLAMLVGFVYLYQRATRQMHRYTTVTGKGYRPKLIEIGRLKYAGIALIVFVFIVTAGLPILVFILTGFFPKWRTHGLEALWHPSLESFRETFSSAEVLESIKNTFIVTLVTPIVTVGMISVASWLIVRSNLGSKAKVILDAVTFWPHAYPGIVLGIALLWFFIMVDFPPVWGTLWPIILGLTVSYMPFTARTLNAAFIQIHKELEQAAYISGAGWFSTFRKILLPLALPALASAGLWVALHAMRSLTVPMFLTTYGNEVLPVLVWSFWENDMVENVAVIGLLYSSVCVVLSLVWRYVGFRSLGK